MGGVVANAHESSDERYTATQLRQTPADRERDHGRLPSEKGPVPMRSIPSALRTLHSDQRGLTTVEYAIVLCLIAAASVSLWNKLGSNLHEKLGEANTAIDDHVQTSFD